jgi:hypothetical protein
MEVIECRASDLDSIPDREGWQPYEPTEGLLKGLKLQKRTATDGDLKWCEIKGVNPWQSWRLWWRETQIDWPLFIVYWSIALPLLGLLIFLIYHLIKSLLNQIGG